MTAIVLIAGFSITGLLLQGLETVSLTTSSPKESATASHGIVLVANPVVHIAVPEHNVFTSH